jgi:hypothetical protein
MRLFCRMRACQTGEEASPVSLQGFTPQIKPNDRRDDHTYDQQYPKGHQDYFPRCPMSLIAVLFNLWTSPTWSRASNKTMLASVRRPFSRGLADEVGFDFSPGLVKHLKHYRRCLRRIGGAFQQPARFHNLKLPASSQNGPHILRRRA